MQSPRKKSIYIHCFNYDCSPVVAHVPQETVCITDTSERFAITALGFLDEQVSHGLNASILESTLDFLSDLHIIGGYSVCHLNEGNRECSFRNRWKSKKQVQVYVSSFVSSFTYPIIYSLNE